MYSADGEHVSSSSYVLMVDATVHFLSEEHLPFAIAAFLILVFISLPALLLIYYPCNILRCLNRCSRRRWHALQEWSHRRMGSEITFWTVFAVSSCARHQLPYGTSDKLGCCVH